jgi:hypothetical protein
MNNENNLREHGKFLQTYLQNYCTKYNLGYQLILSNFDDGKRLIDTSNVDLENTITRMITVLGKVFDEYMKEHKDENLNEEIIALHNLIKVVATKKPEFILDDDAKERLKSAAIFQMCCGLTKELILSGHKPDDLLDDLTIEDIEEMEVNNHEFIKDIPNTPEVREFIKSFMKAKADEAFKK